MVHFNEKLAHSLDAMASRFAEIVAREKEQSAQMEFFDGVSKFQRAYQKEIPSLVSKVRRDCCEC